MANHKYTVTKSVNNKMVNVVVYADHFQTTVDGSLVFYLNANNGGSSIPVLAYPHGEWFACNLQSMADYPVANSVESVLGISQQPKTNQAGAASKSGINTAPTVEERDKARRLVMIESELKSFIQSRDFEFPVFMKHLRDQGVTPTNNELEWAVANAIKNGKVPARKFINAQQSALLDAQMKGAMNRHWDEAKRIFSIFEIMKDKNETRDLDAIVLTAWIFINGYLK